MKIVVDPKELRAWRKRLGVSQAVVAEKAGTDRERVSFIETRIVGMVTTYIAVNQALVAIQAERQGEATKEEVELIAA